MHNMHFNCTGYTGNSNKSYFPIFHSITFSYFSCHQHRSFYLQTKCHMLIFTESPAKKLLKMQKEVFASIYSRHSIHLILWYLSRYLNIFLFFFFSGIIGQLEEKNNNLDKLFKLYEEGIKHYPEDPIIYSNLGAHLFRWDIDFYLGQCQLFGTFCETY